MARIQIVQCRSPLWIASQWIWIIHHVIVIILVLIWETAVMTSKIIVEFLTAWYLNGVPGPLVAPSAAPDYLLEAGRSSDQSPMEGNSAQTCNNREVVKVMIHLAPKEIIEIVFHRSSSSTLPVH